MAELFQLVGSILRDIAQARNVSDMFSRQLSHSYERDSLLRRFPVPRAEISEVEFELKFALSDVIVDPKRCDSRDQKVTSIFELYSSRIVDESLEVVKRYADSLAAGSSQAELKAAVQRFEVRYFSKPYREQLHSRLLRYFESNQAAIIDANGVLQEQPVLERLQKFASDLAEDSEEIKSVLAISHSDPRAILEAVLRTAGNNLEAMQPAIREAYSDLKDFSVEVNVKAEDLRGTLPISSIKVKASIRNYRWEKVDVDQKEMRSVRVLTPE